VTPTLRVLIIDDAEEDATLVVRALVSAGYEVRHERVSTEQSLRAALDRDVWDLAIADYTLRRFSGIAALRLVRQQDADLPFVFVSSTTGEDAAVDAMKAGAHDYMRKGALKRLLPAVRHELREAAARRERRRLEQRMAHLAYHDPLTDLPNRTLLHDRLAQAIRAAHRAETLLALLVLDLDGFKEINDTYGHRAGDRVLQHIAQRMRVMLRDVDTVARLGGDEFALVLPTTDLNGAAQTAGKVLQEIELPCIIDHRQLSVRGSIGIACCPDHGKSADLLLQRADIAMYQAKADGVGIAVYAPKRERPHQRRRSG
jgi:diguanylate cyclase (GGDEF)-like protein